MDRQQIFNETKAYEEREQYSVKEIYNTCMAAYSNTKTLRKFSEHLLADIKYDKCGVIPEMSITWYGYNYRLFLFRYEKNTLEEISTYASKILFVDSFKPKEGIFNEKVNNCLFVITETQVILYGIDKYTRSLINTNFVVSISSVPVVYTVSNGSIFLGCEDGNVYEVVYKGLESWTFKMMYLYNPNASLVSYLVPSILKRKCPRIRAMSSNNKFLLTLGKHVTVYNIEGGIYKVKEISVYKDYIGIQILDDKFGNVFFYCYLKDGTRDFFDTKHLYSKQLFIDDRNNDDSNHKIKTWEKHHLLVQKDKYQGNIMYFVSFNDYQKINIDRSKACENLETIVVPDDIVCCQAADGYLYLAFKNKIVIYEIMSYKRYMTLSRIQDVCTLVKNIGYREALALYFELMASNADVSKLEYLFVKVSDIHLKGLFSFIYREIGHLMLVPLQKLYDDDRHKSDIDNVKRKFKNLSDRLRSSELSLGVEFMKYFNQTVYFANLLNDYSIDFQGQTLYSLVVDSNPQYKKYALNELMEAYKINQSLDTLINMLSNNAKDYLPMNDIYYYKGFDLLKKYPSKEKLWESLKNFKLIPYNENIIQKYNDLMFYSGSVILLGKYFNFDYETEVKLLRSAIRCGGAIKHGLEDNREDFQFTFFEALCMNLKNENMAPECACCDVKTKMKFTEIIKLQSKYLEDFLKEKSINSNDPCMYELYWKYCAYRDERVKAVESLLYLIQNKTTNLEKKIDLLQKAKTVSLHTEYQSVISSKMYLLKVQQELIHRGEHGKFISNMLLSANTLFNDYAYKYPDLSLKIVDKFILKDKNLLREIWNKCLDSDFASAVAFIKYNKFSGNALDCEIIGDLLLDRMHNNDFLCQTLSAVGFSNKEIQKYIEQKLKNTDDKELHNFLVKDYNHLPDDVQSMGATQRSVANQLK